MLRGGGEQVIVFAQELGAGGPDEAQQVVSWRFKCVPDQIFDEPPRLSVRPSAGGDGLDAMLTLGKVRAGFARFEVWLEDDGPSDARSSFPLNERQHATCTSTYARMRNQINPY